MSNDNKITKTNDGYVVELFAKIEKDIEQETLNVAEGISILESFFEDTEEKQFETYKTIAEKMQYSPVIIRTYEKNKKILKTQIKALLRAAQYGDLSIIFPKVSTVTDLIEYKNILEICKVELKSKDIAYKNNIKIGVILEIPSAVLMSYDIARECDFLFIDTNSLTNYTFGKETNASQTAIIKLIKYAVEGAHDAGIFCGIYGNIVENEEYIPILIGLEIDEFSMSSKKISKVREKINKIDKYDCKELAEEIFSLKSIEEIEKKLKEFEK